MKTLSVKQPFASLICGGVKTVENRTWTTDYRGRLLIHASGDNLAWCYNKYLPEQVVEILKKYPENGVDFLADLPFSAPEHIRRLFALFEKMLAFYGLTHADVMDADTFREKMKKASEKTGLFMPSCAITGECELVDIVKDSTDAYAEPNQFHWILKNAILYDKPKKNVMGHLRLWEFDENA